MAKQKEEDQINKDEITEGATTENENECSCGCGAEAAARNFEAEIAQLGDQLLRLAAEYDNFRRRSQKEKDCIYGDAVTRTVTGLLPVIDDFERAVGTPCGDEKYKEGMLLVQKKFTEYIAKLGITEIAADGEFNPELHNAISHIEDDNLPPNSIASVMQKGYKIGDKVIRHTLVTVAN